VKRSNVLDKELRDLLRKELKEYEQTISDLTSDERKELREWIKKGRSVYDNPWYISMGNGWPLDYIKASRTFDEILNNPELYDTEDCTASSAYEKSTTDDLPF
jgi:hypothetical protein